MVVNEIFQPDRYAWKCMLREREIRVRNEKRLARRTIT